jgi:hypothetical protein
MTRYDKLWNGQYQQLVEFKRKNGHCMVSFKYEQDESLGRWVSTQRKYHKQNKLGLDRKRGLDEIGFAWNAEGARNLGHSSEKKVWHQQYEKLLEYKQKNGHCKVPNMYKDNKSLGIWVRTQRVGHANNKMQPDRKELLDALDFVWKAVPGPARYSTSSSVGLPNEALKETDQAQGHVKNRSEYPSPNRKRPSTSLVESVGMGARINQRGKATASSSSVEEYGGGRDEAESKPSLVTSGAPIGSSPGQEVVQEQATALGEIPYGWTRVKLEPDC